MIVLDASALLAYVHAEPGGENVAREISTTATISAVNLSEVAGKLADVGRSPREVVHELTEQGILGKLLNVEPLTQDDAFMIAELRPATRHLGLSLADRACVALGIRLGAPVLTADRAWAGLDLGIEVRLSR